MGWNATVRGYQKRRRKLGERLLYSGRFSDYKKKHQYHNKKEGDGIRASTELLGCQSDHVLSYLLVPVKP
jgi:hypothetical protein